LSAHQIPQATGPSGAPFGPPLSDRGYALLTLLCLGLLLAFRLLALYASKVDLVMDEAQYWTWSRDVDFGYFSKPPMIAWVIRAMAETCGLSEACTRAASPILYTLTSGLLFVIARTLFDARAAFWTAVIFATLPGVSYASALITTDAPLIFLWTLMMFFWVMLVKRKSMGFAILLGVAIGMGLLAKQAMIYAVLCIACHAIVSREAREALKGGRAIVAGLIAVALFSPNIVWNSEHGWPTAKHTGDNMGWRPPYVHPLAALEFIGAQFALFGPILFAVLVRAGIRHVGRPDDTRKTLLLCFSLPILLTLVLQALLSRAHGNWAATAYPAATVFVTAILLEHGRRVLLGISMALHIAVAAAIGIAPAFARTWLPFEQLTFLRSSIAWEETADAVRKLLSEGRYGAVVVDTRDLTAELLYYMRDVDTPLYAWKRKPEPHHHYQMTRPFVAGVPEPVLLVSVHSCRRGIAQKFESVTVLPTVEIPLVKDETRTLHACVLSGYRGAGQ
jgi:4-amino-4-deoxy-L-arabinose transferase-like glycosyltransferase